MTDIRKTALSLLESYEAEGRYVNLLPSSPILKNATREERAAVTGLLYTTVENKLRYDYIISALSGRPTSELSLHVLAILRLGMCQILDMDSIPDFAAVNETVRLAERPWERSLINAVLRRAVNEKESLPVPERARNEIRYLSVRYSVPRETVKLLAGRFGTEAAEAMLQRFSQHGELGITPNLARTTQEQLLCRFGEAGINAVASRHGTCGITLFDAGAVTELPGFREGDFFVQDEASRIAAAALDVGAGHTVVDVCAAPGGKSFAAAIAAAEGRVYSFDLHESKLSLIEGGAERLGIENMTPRALDATVGDDALCGKADRVICDVPCSGLGVIGKKPDLRYKDFAGAVGELVPLQLAILKRSSEYLKEGGVLVYSTCTLTEEENEGVIRAFLEGRQDMHLEPFAVGDIDAPSGFVTLLPHIHNTDGFFIAKLRRGRK